ncbi:hypothetical protein CJU79_23090 [Pseudomonas fragi]|uniref:hypothetical protein n=1 Tax=Pseudomonas fragi TaxID=296 RepID=UPI000BA22687|nr:hypothetical protein [Pseudomonas fragi]PAA33116.1 hypothetical protein CJU79_23090 [Pseudomonas fragi]
MIRPLSIQIIRRDDAPSPGMPSQFSIGAGVDGALFQILGLTRPTELELFSALVTWNDCASLVSYDLQSGVGFFQVIDDYAPNVGEVIELLIQDVKPDRTVIIYKRCGATAHSDFSQE